MALKALSSFSLLSLTSTTHYSHSFYPPPPSSLFKPKSLTPLLSSQSPVSTLLPPLEPDQLSQQQETQRHQEDEDEEEIDPIRSFFASHSNNHRTAALPTSKAVEEILTISRNLPENSSLGNDCLSAYVGKLSKDDCSELLEKMGQDSPYSCLSVFYWMMSTQASALLSPRACSATFVALGVAEMGEEAMVLFDKLLDFDITKEFMDVGVYNAAIASLAATQRYDDAWRVYEVLEATNVMPDQVTCSVLISVMKKSGKNAKHVWEFFLRMNRKGVCCNLAVFDALIKCFCAEGLKKEALIVQSEMEKRGISSTAGIYKTLMEAYVKSSQVEAAEGLFVEMKEKGLEPTTATYNTLMNAYSRRLQPEVIEDMLLEMHALGLKPNVKSYTCLISAYGRQRQKSDLAADTFLKMKNAGIKPTVDSYTALIHAYSVGGWQLQAHAAYKRMISEGIKPTIETYTTLLDAFRRAGDTQTLMEIWRTMVIDEVVATRVTFHIVLDGLAKNGLYVQARDVILEYGRLGFQPTVMTYNVLMNAYARGGQHYKLPQLLKEMSALNLKPDNITYTTMIYAYVRVRDFERAFYYHKQMVKSGQMPDGKAYHRLRTILDESGKTKNRRDRSAIMGIVSSKIGFEHRKGKKDEFWKGKNRQSRITTGTRYHGHVTY